MAGTSTSNTAGLQVGAPMSTKMADPEAETGLDENSNRKRKQAYQQIPQSKIGAPSLKTPKTIQDDIFRNVDTLMVEFPEAKPDAIFAMLENGMSMDEIRVKLRSSTLFPPLGPSHQDKAGPSTQPSHESVDVPGPSGPGGLNWLRTLFTEKREFLTMTDVDKQGLWSICSAFPDLDPMFALEEMTKRQKSADEVMLQLVSSNSVYPKLKGWVEKEKKERRRKEFLDPTKFNIAYFLRIFPDPEAFFNNTEKPITKLYETHLKACLMNEFLSLRADFIDKTIRDNKSRLLPSYRALKEVAQGVPARGEGGGGRKRVGAGRPTYLQKDRETLKPWPEVIDEMFFRELQYARNEDEIKEYKRKMDEEKVEMLEKGRVEGTLQECQVCFNDGFLTEEMIPCSDVGHRFCTDCTKTHAETQIGNGMAKVSCLSDGCDKEVPIKSLREIILPTEVDLLIRRKQQEDLRAANIDNMEECPFCNFALIMETEDKIFRCLNPDCLKVSCRDCHLESHIPFKCKQMEQADETKMRVFIENQMAEAMIRKCPTCQKRIIKSSGCNKVICACGAYICYMCGVLLDKKDPYPHFDRAQPNTKRICRLTMSIDKVNADVAERAGVRAKKEYLKEHPELRERDKEIVEVDQLVQRNKDVVRP